MNAARNSQRKGREMSRLIATSNMSSNQLNGHIGNLKGQGRREKDALSPNRRCSFSNRRYRFDLISQKDHPFRIFALVEQYLEGKYGFNKSKKSESLYFKGVENFEGDLRLSRHLPNTEGCHYREGIIIDYDGDHFVDSSIPEELRLEIESRVSEPEKYYVSPRKWLFH